MNIQNIFNLYNCNRYSNKFQLNFKRLKKPVYVIDENEDYKKFNSEAEAAQYMNVYASYFSTLLSGQRRTLKNYAFAKASEVEKYDKNSTPVVDKKQIKEFANLIKKKNSKAQSSLNESATKETTPNHATGQNSTPQGIYAIKSNGQYQKFASVEEIEKILGFKKESVNLVLYKDLKAIFDYTFTRASEVETENKEGKFLADEVKIDNFAQSTFSKNIYIIDKKGNYKKFDSQADAAKFLDCSREMVRRALHNKVRAKGYLVVKASDVETKLVNSGKVVDRTKITKILRDNILKELNKNYYIIYKNGKYEKFTSQAQMAAALNCSQTRVFALINKGGISKQKEFAILKASEIERIKENYETEIDKKAIENIIKILQKN